MSSINNSTSTRVATAIPTKCQVLVIGGGPGGSYAACALAREGLDVVLLEAEVFPRYHIGESMLASMRHFLRFVDLDETFDKYGFTKKVGAAFKLNGQKREGFTDFLAAGGPNNYAWNVVRSEADNLIFRHAGKCGAHIFDGVKVSEIEFTSHGFPEEKATEESGVQNKRPISAFWMRKTALASEPQTGKIAFDYLVDASGRAGILSTRYLKNRTFNKGLKNVASWGYWKDPGVYARGTARENVPFFEALKDESGWAWLIPLHNGTSSVGIVMNQDIATGKKKATTPTPTAKEFYLEQLKFAPSLRAILHSATEEIPHCNGKSNDRIAMPEIEERASLISDIKSASDYSYSASGYSLPYARIVGDAGCFIDPYFSSGVHLAFSSALSAAITICAALRGDCREEEACRWHDKKVGVGYTRFLMVVLSAYRQIRAQDVPVLADFEEDNFDRAFAHFRPIIQGTADVSNSKLSQDELSKTLDFCAHAFEPTLPEDRQSVLEKLNNLTLKSHPVNGSATTANTNGASDHPNGQASANIGPSSILQSQFDANLTEEEHRILKHIRARRAMRTEDTMGLGSFSTDVIDGFGAKIVMGGLGLDRRV